MDNRQTLLDCALRLFAMRGYDAVGVQEIADAASVSKPTLYHYFGSKHGLLDVLVQEKGDALLADVVAAEYRRDLPQSLVRVTEAMFRFARLGPDTYRMIVGFFFMPAASEAHSAVLPLNRALYEILEGLFREAAVEAGNTRGKHRELAATFLGTVHTWVSLFLSGQAQLTEAAARRAVQQFLHGIYS